MTNANLSGERMDAWLVDASRRLDEPTGDVARLISSIVSGLPQLRRPGRELDTDDELVTVNDRVIKQLLATRIRTASGRLVVRLELHGDDAALTGVTVGLIARYRDDLHERADVVREAARAVLVDSLGPSATAEACANIHVRWQDVYTREWLN
ncbi:hypothetical protein [Gordonia phthalatica]|uniref:Uncharacterized protein n=1 Tax=Gordonia phthalatica TaxID=1136941 RepID=A0A0N7FV32_9ACTN|nr:hypothetical protein [Gordonia phthalatica]ALG86031.1 hypothetical protein ACH46_17925 [Gordonia phthalatica]